MKPAGTWLRICAREDILPDGGAAALILGKQVAIFRLGEAVYALDNYDPNSGANVLARGILGDVNGEPVVASPVYKDHYSLITGRCLEKPERSVRTWPARVHDDAVWIKTAPRPAPRRRRLVVVGNGVAGMKVVEELLAVAADAYEITVFGAEPHPGYNRVLLTPLLTGEKRLEDITLNSPEWFAEHGVTLHTGDPVVVLDRARRIARSRSGIEAPYDRLLLATGSNAAVLPIPGADLRGVVTFRDLADVDSMLEAAAGRGSAVVIGGGLLGLEAAHGLARRGMRVTVVHMLETLMERQLDPAAARMLKESLERRGLAFRMSARTTAILAEASGRRACAVGLADGSRLDADLIVMAVGIRPNVELARAAGLRCDRGVLVDDTLQTFDPCIYAVGECVQHRNSTYGLVAPLLEQARVCATHLAERGLGRYRGSLLSTQLKVTGIDVLSAGDILGGRRSEALVLRDEARGIYKRLVIEDDRICGVVLYGDTRDGPWYCDLMRTARSIGALRETLLFGGGLATAQGSP